jgi:CheY-like chemotaxis protein
MGVKQRFQPNLRLLKEREALGERAGLFRERVAPKGHAGSPSSTRILPDKTRANDLTDRDLAHNDLNSFGGAAMGRVIALMDDLFFQMKLAETAKHLGLEVKVATNPDALDGLLDPAPKLAIVDLNARNQPLAAIQRLRTASKDLRIVGFLSHVQRDLAAQAQKAGCDEVLPRSAFSQNLAGILAAAKD